MAGTKVGIRNVSGREEQPFVTASDLRVLTEPIARGSARYDGAPSAPRRRQLVGLANVHAMNRGVETREPAFGFVADRLLVLQVLIRGRVHGEDDQ